MSSMRREAGPSPTSKIQNGVGSRSTNFTLTLLTFIVWAQLLQEYYEFNKLDLTFKKTSCEILRWWASEHVLSFFSVERTTILSACATRESQRFILKGSGQMFCFSAIPRGWLKWRVLYDSTYNRNKQRQEWTEAALLSSLIKFSEQEVG